MDDDRQGYRGSYNDQRCCPPPEHQQAIRIASTPCYSRLSAHNLRVRC
jgi:hypothetical protein